MLLRGLIEWAPSSKFFRLKNILVGGTCYASQMLHRGGMPFLVSRVLNREGTF